MKKSLLIIVVPLLLVSLSTFFYLRSKAEGDRVELITTKVRRGVISSEVTATGTLQPVDTVAVGSQISGTIKKIHVDFNSVVKKGQLIAELDKSLLQAQVDQYKASLQSMESQLVYAKENYDRQTTLFDSGGISRADYETATNQYQTALAAVGSVKAQLTAAVKNLSYASIYSPISGTVLSRNMSEGQTVAASFNTPVLFSIAKDLTKMQVRASVDEADVGYVKEGEPVSFTVDAFPNESFKGNVEEVRLQPAVTANVVTYTTIIDAPNPDNKLKPGMTANVSITIRQATDALLLPPGALSLQLSPNKINGYTVLSDSSKVLNSSQVPTSSLSPDEKTATVWLVQGNTIKRKNIITGLNDNIHVQVISGLNENDVIVESVRERKKKDKANSENSPFIPSRRPAATSNTVPARR